MMNDVEVLILCGGEGRRLRDAVPDLPKPMAPVNGKPFIEYLISSISSQGFKNICFLTGYKAESIYNFIKARSFELNIRFSKETTPLGTGGAIFEAIKGSPFKSFLVVNGDTFFNVPLSDFVSELRPGTLKIALKNTKDLSRYGVVLADAEGFLVSFDSDPASTQNKAAGQINGGIYYFDRQTLEPLWPNKKSFSFEKEVIPRLVEKKRAYSQAFENDFIDIGIPADYYRAQKLAEDWVFNGGQKW